MSILKKIVRLFFIFSLLACSTLSYAQTATREYQLKAVFIFNLTQFVEWPVSSFPSPQTPLVIGILGKDPFGSYLDETVSGEKVNGHPLVIQRYQDVGEIKMCHLLFINPTENSKAVQVIDNLKGRSILTVGDKINFAQQGGMVRFITENNKIQFRINLEAAKAADLVISSKLLKFAEIVGNDK